jgi:hypothetical protein
MMKDAPLHTSSFVEDIKRLLREAQQSVVRSVSSIMVQTYFELGKRIVEHEQDGREHADYGGYLLERLSQDLTAEFGKGCSKRNLELVRKFYLVYRNAKSPISQNISWTHYNWICTFAFPFTASLTELMKNKTK